MLGTLEQIVVMGNLAHAAGWAALAIALLVAVILTAEYYLFGRAEMDMPVAVRHGAGLLIIFAGVWAWALVVHWIFPALMFTLTVGIGSAFMALWHLVDYRENEAQRPEELEAASREAETWIETLPSLPPDEHYGTVLTTGDVAKYCHVSLSGVSKWIKKGQLPAYTTPGGHHRILLSDFKAFLTQHRMPINETYFSGAEAGTPLLIVHDQPQ